MAECGLRFLSGDESLMLKAPRPNIGTATRDMADYFQSHSRLEQKAKEESK